MRTTTRLCLVLAVVATAGLVAVPGTASAQADASTQAGASGPKLDKKQNRAIKKVNRRTTRLRNWNFGLVEKNKDQDASLAGVKGVVDAIVDGVPQITGGLRALETGLRSLAGAYFAVEYGTVALFQNGNNIAEVTSSDIPDDGNTALASGTIPVSAAAGDTFTLRAVIRSGESDGKATGDPAGQAGGLLFAVCSPIPGVGATDCSSGLGGGTSGGQIVCAPSQTPEQGFNIPDSPDESLPLVNIQEKHDRTDQSQPADKIEDDQSTSLGVTCTVPISGLYTVHVNTQFADIPTTSSPGGTD